MDSVEMPWCDALHVVDWLHEVGPMSADGPVTHSEISAWQENTGIELDSWSARMLRRLSSEYVREHVEATDPGRPSPYTPPQTSDEAREMVGRQVKNAMAAYFMAKKGQK